MRNLDSQIQTTEKIIEELRGQLGDLHSELDQGTGELESRVSELQSGSTNIQNTVIDLERHNTDLQSTLDSYKNLTSIALGVALLIFISGVVIIFQNQSRG
jgi:chromosome segregation ATPase